MSRGISDVTVTITSFLRLFIVCDFLCQIFIPLLQESEAVERKLFAQCYMTSA